MHYQLSTGKTIIISFEEWLNLDDLKIQELLAANAGMDIEDPFLDLKTKPDKIRYPGTFNIEELPDIEEVVEPLPPDVIEQISKQIKSD